jgi:hypothetical protein
MLHCTKLHLSKCNSFMSYLRKTKCEFHISTASQVRIFFKSSLIKSCSSLKVYRHTTFHDPALTGTSVATTSEVWMAAILESLKLQNIKLCRGQLQWQKLTIEFHKMYNFFKSFFGGDTHTHTLTDTQPHRQECDLISLHFSFRKESRLYFLCIALLLHSDDTISGSLTLYRYCIRSRVDPCGV